MSTFTPPRWAHASARLLCALAMLGGAHGALAANTPAATTPEGFGAGTTGGGQTTDIVTVHTKADLVRELCRTYGSTGLCTDNAPRVIKLTEVIDFTGSENQEMDSVCYPGKVCTAPYKNEALIPLDANDHRCDGLPMKTIAVDLAGKKPLVVGSNKTVLGVGANAGLKGKGLQLNTVSNVIIQNLTISDINNGIIFGGDAITITNSHHVWINHNRIANIGRQMLVSHLGATTNITISWNIFDGNNVYSPNCNGQHYFNLLMAGSPATITLSNNWFKNVSGRAPDVKSTAATVHMINNYFINDVWTPDAAHALEAKNETASTTGANVLVEGNYFKNIALPILDTEGNVFGSLPGANSAIQTQCKNTLARNCYDNVATPAPLQNYFVQDSAVMTAFKAVPAAQVVAGYAASDVPANVSAKAGPGKN